MRRCAGRADASVHVRSRARGRASTPARLRQVVRPGPPPRTGSCLTALPSPGVATGGAPEPLARKHPKGFENP
ncbi:MAG: hypothetical protein MUC97_09035 [Bernardetiaceae bacterium]|nr:hypothetical protein [Bernardetiaceae bacterium]